MNVISDHELHSIFNHRVGFKSPATISQDQQTASYAGKDGVLATRGRHDPCVVPRAVAIVEAMAALTLMDALLAQDSRTLASSRLSSDPVLELPNSMRLAKKLKTGGIQK
jgi:chorismate synthase